MKLDKVLKALGKETASDLDALDVDGLKARVVQAEQSVKQAEEELDNNEQYQELKESLKAVTAGLKEVKKRQKAITFYSLHLIEEKGKA